MFSEDDFVNFPNYHIYLKLMIDGMASKIFSAVTLVPVDGEKSHKEKIVEVSRRRYGKRDIKTEQEIIYKESSITRGTSIQGSLFL